MHAVIFYRCIAVKLLSCNVVMLQCFDFAMLLCCNAVIY